MDLAKFYVTPAEVGCEGKTHQRVIETRWSSQRPAEVGCEGKTHQRVPMTRWSSQRLEEVGCGGKMHQRVIETRWSSQRPAEVGCEGERSVARGENVPTSHRDSLVIAKAGRGWLRGGKRTNESL